MSVALLVITDGRHEYLRRCVASMVGNVSGMLLGDVTEMWMYDDSGDDEYRARLAAEYPQFRHINGGLRRGFAGATRYAWAQLSRHSKARFVFWLEQDFVFARPVVLDDLAAVLDANPHLAQMALRRQAWNAGEVAAGGVVECAPDSFTERADELNHAWLEHRLFWTTNPSLYRLTMCANSWPVGPQSEGRFTNQLLRHGTVETSGDRVQFGYWGERSSGVWVEHIGHERAGYGY